MCDYAIVLLMLRVCVRKSRSDTQKQATLMCVCLSVTAGSLRHARTQSHLMGDLTSCTTRSWTQHTQ